MKNYSAEVVTRSHVEEAAAEAFHNARMHADSVAAEAAAKVDAKQDEQIKKLRIWLGVSFAVNFLLALGAYL